jgi:hypothetical protein
MQYHSLRNGRMAGSDQPAGPFLLDHTDPARSGWDEILVMAERWDYNPRLFRSLQNCHSLSAFNFPIIDSNFQGSHLPHHSFLMQPWRIAAQKAYSSAGLEPGPIISKAGLFQKEKQFPVPGFQLPVVVKLFINESVGQYGIVP